MAEVNNSNKQVIKTGKKATKRNEQINKMTVVKKGDWEITRTAIKAFKGDTKIT